MDERGEILMNFSDLMIENQRPLKVMCRLQPSTIPDSDLSNWSIDELLTCWKGSQLWYIEVFL